jgi:hypothetical protein
MNVEGIWLIQQLVASQEAVCVTELSYVTSLFSDGYVWHVLATSKRCDVNFNV